MLHAVGLAQHVFAEEDRHVRRLLRVLPLQPFQRGLRIRAAVLPQDFDLGIPQPKLPQRFQRDAHHRGGLFLRAHDAAQAKDDFNILPERRLIRIQLSRATAEREYRRHLRAGGFRLRLQGRAAFRSLRSFNWFSGHFRVRARVRS